ncbi:MAG: hypothetical protein ABI181_10075 [Mycobacteriaceae bacterium]
MRTRPVGSLVGAIAGLVFVLVNSGAVPGSLLWRAAAAVAFVAVIWFVVLRGPEVEQAPPSRDAVRTYGFAVVAMVVAIPVGARILSDVLDRPSAVLVWVVFVVGAHFLPFAHAFHLPVFRLLAASLVVVAIIGAVPTLTSNSEAAAGWTGVAAGFVLLFFSAAGPHLSRSSAARSAGSVSTTASEAPPGGLR